jgi:hypothetical protein
MIYFTVQRSFVELGARLFIETTIVKIKSVLGKREIRYNKLVRRIRAIEGCLGTMRRGRSW